MIRLVNGDGFNIDMSYDSSSPEILLPVSCSITCHECGMQSWHPKDVEHRYCGNCHKFHPGEIDGR